MPFSHLTCLVYFTGFLLLTYLAAFVLCITLEAPWLGLEKIFHSSHIGANVLGSKLMSKRTGGGGGGRVAAPAGGSRGSVGGGGGREETPSPTLGDNDRNQGISKARL